MANLRIQMILFTVFQTLTSRYIELKITDIKQNSNNRELQQDIYMYYQEVGSNFSIPDVDMYYEEEIIPRETEIGTQCEFPFIHLDEVYNNCFWGSDGREYCKVDGIMYACISLWPDHDLEEEKDIPLPDSSDIVERFTVTGKKCEFPKKFNGRYLTDCLYISASREQCYAGGKWEYCTSLKSPTSNTTANPTTNPTTTITLDPDQIAQRYTTNGQMCDIPYVHQNQIYTNCTNLSDGKEWCKVDNKWQRCAESGSRLLIRDYSSSYGEDDSNLLVSQSQSDDIDDSQSQSSTRLLLIVTLVLVLLIVAGLGVYLVVMRRKLSYLLIQVSGDVELVKFNTSKKNVY
eukprot:TRINITY_DN554_c0_g1_i3.p1 TRINITY_DN554_c0_g1~~TRINITY_DN554_c0_g1_i3.p1  ORF type:complete len:346 (-),score=19.34 TRINITY_DN554_c0_g1_i3:254-1291(-)